MFRPFYLSAFALVMLACINANGQSGQLSGAVMDSVLNETVFGAIVRIDGTELGAATDFDGKFLIDKIPAGTYSVRVSAMTYQEIVFTNIKITGGEMSDLGTIYVTTQNLGVVEIIADRPTSTQAAVVIEMKNSDAVVSGTSAEQIRKSQDNNAAEAIKRVPGVTLIDNRFVMVRGLNERYNTVLLNNAIAPSSEADIRAFSFDIIPSSMIDRMLVYKSASPDLPGDFAGGAIKIYTKSLPEKDFMNISYYSSFRSGTTYKDFSEQDKGKNSWLGYDDGTYALPDDAPEDYATINDRNQAAQLSKSFNNTWLASEAIATPDMRFNFQLGRRGRMSRESLWDYGSITSVNYSNTRATTSWTRLLKYPEEESTSPIFDFREKQYNHTVRLGVMQNFALRKGTKHLFEFKNLYNHLGLAQFLYREGYLDEVLSDVKDYTLSNQFRGVFSSQLNGKHELKERLNVDWTVGYSQSNRDEPDTRRYRQKRDFNAGDDVPYFTDVPYGTSSVVVSPNFLGRLFAETHENAVMGAVNLDYTFKFEKMPEFSPKIKVGSYIEKKNKTYQVRNIGFNTANSAVQTLSLEELFDESNFGNLQTGLIVGESTQPDYHYEAYNNLFAYYASASIPVTKKFNIIGGARIENNVQHLESNSRTEIDANGDYAPLIIDNPINTLLPSVNLNYNFSEKTLIRGGYSKTINRPEFREIANLAYFDFQRFVVVEGNPNLKTPRVDNYDLRFEHYPTPSEIISIGVFYKDFTDPIESILAVSQNPTQSYLNAQSAYSAGTELEVRKALGPMFEKSDFMQSMSVVFNAALIQSKVTISDTLALQDSERPLFGQSPYIVNGGLYYSNDSTKLSVTLNYNVIGPRIFLVGNIDRADIYEMPRHQLDLTITKMVRNNIELRLGIQDILNQTQDYLQDFNTNKKLERTGDGDVKYATARYGAYWTFGLALKL
ncbi:MAG: TonB-dependent receptor domain-containing protein [Flavobacteriales bacterium]